MASCPQVLGSVDKSSSSVPDYIRGMARARKAFNDKMHQIHCQIEMERESEQARDREMNASFSVQPSKVSASLRFPSRCKGANGVIDVHREPARE